MTTTDPLTRFGTKQTPQTTKVPGTDQVKNNASGFVFEIDPLSQLRRFLIMGSAGGTYYVGENALTEENGLMIIEMTLTDEDHRIMVDEIVDISLAGRAQKQNPTLFALAIACQMGTTEAKQYARRQINKVVRTGTHLFQFVGYLQQFGGWGRGIRTAVGRWYTDKDPGKLAYQVVKYRQREGYTHRDVLRLTHPKFELSPEMQELEDQLTEYNIAHPEEPKEPPAELLQAHERLEGLRAVVDWVVKGEISDENDVATPDMIKGFIRANKPKKKVVKTLEKFPGLPWEALPDSAMNDTAVWDKLLDNGMPINALVRQLSRLTQLGMLPQMGGRTDDVLAQLLNAEAVEKSKIHPFAVLTALYTYRSGRGFRSTWTPSAKVIDGLDELFYLSFGNVEATGKRIMQNIDVSGSMGANAAGNLPMTAREAAAAMAMVTIRTEPNQMTMGFTDGSRPDSSHSSNAPWQPNSWYNNRPRYIGGARNARDMNDTFIAELPLSKRQRLDDVIKTVSGLNFGGTNCALPMLHALHKDLEIDTFVIYTDNEAWYGTIHPYQALAQYRKTSGIDARLIVVSMTPTKFSIADPKDPGMLDIAGFDSATPQLISNFGAGVL